MYIYNIYINAGERIQPNVNVLMDLICFFIICRLDREKSFLLMSPTRLVQCSEANILVKKKQTCNVCIHVSICLIIYDNVVTFNIHDEKELNGFFDVLSLSHTHLSFTSSNDVIVVVMIMMVFVYVMMDLLGRQFGAFVSLMIDVFGLLLSGGGGGGRVLRLLQFATADHRCGPVVLSGVTRRILDPVVFLGRYIVTVQLVLLASDVLEVFVLSVLLVVMLVRRHVCHRFEVVRAPRHLGRQGSGLATPRPRSVINDLRRLVGFPKNKKKQKRFSKCLWY